MSMEVFVWRQKLAVDSFFLYDSMSPGTLHGDVKSAPTQPDLPGGIAATALRKLIAFELKSAGFDSAQKDSLDSLEGVVWSCTYHRSAVPSVPPPTLSFSASRNSGT